MICAASNISYGSSAMPGQMNEDKMLHADEQYAHTIVPDKHKLDNLYALNNNNNIIESSKMPGPLLHELEPSPNGPSNGLDDQRALQLALELSMLGLTNDDDHVFSDTRVKKSMNMTECVPVPSSEHVAEIVGRQGCKIKALRAKTNTYIKTPVRGEEPVFVVTGRKEDVALAKQEILQAAEHFSQIRASRRNSSNLSPLGPPSPTAPGHVTKQVRVPYRVVGLVVGPKGSTIKRIQQATNTYIVTPSRDKEPVFEVTGLPENVDRAKREVEHHIALRTGGIIDPTHPESNDHLLNGFTNSLFSPTASSSGTSFSAFLDHNHPNHMTQHHRSHSSDSFGYFTGSSGGSSKFGDLGSSAASPFTNNAFFYDNAIPSPTTDMEAMGQFDPAPGSPSPSLWPEMGRSSLINRAVGSQPQSNVMTSRSISVNNFSPVNGESAHESPAHLQRLLSEPGQDVFSALQSTLAQYNGATAATSTVQSNGFVDAISTSSILGLSSSIIDASKSVATSDGESQSSSPDWMNREKAAKNCMVCQGGPVVAALVPCGHNLFCMECAEQVKDDGGECPACQRKVEAVLRIFT